MDIRVVITGHWMDVYTWPLMFLDRMIVKAQKHRRGWEKMSLSAKRQLGIDPKGYIAFFRAVEWILMVAWALCYYVLLIILKAVNFLRSLFEA